jgi:hypothetical protein
MNKAMGAIEIDKSLEVEIERSLHALKGPATVPHLPAHEMTADNLGKSLRRMTTLDERS